MYAAAVLLAVLVLLEYLFWLSPLAPWFGRATTRLGDWYYLLPYHYLLRVGALGGVVLWLRPALWPTFAGGAPWLYSLLWGLMLAAVTWALGLALGQITRQTFAQKARTWRREEGWRFWVHAAYLAVYPGFVEEWLFRWFFLAALWPAMGWWAALAAPVLNLVWHLPVWWDFAAGAPAGQRGGRLFSVAFPAGVFALLLTLVAALTHNLAGPVLAHAFGDWVGGVSRYNAKSV